MKSFATLCLLGIALAVRLEKPEGEKCMGEIPDEKLALIGEGVKAGMIREGVAEADADQASKDLIDAQKKGASCDDIE